MIIFLFLVFVPISLSAAIYFWSSDGRGNWQTADRSSAGLLPLPSVHPDALIRIYGARTVRWRSIFAIHTWIVVKERGAASYIRYDYTAWGEPIRSNGFAADARWFGAMPETIVAVDGDEASRLIPKVRHVIDTYKFQADGDYIAWPGPNSNTFVQAVLNAVPELKAVLPPTAIGKDYPYDGDWMGLTGSRTGIYVSLGGYLGLRIGWIEGFEINFLGAVVGFDIRRPALKLPGIGRICDGAWRLASHIFSVDQQASGELMPKLSILDLVRVTQETDARGALNNARDLAAHAEDWGYNRIWVAEHHNMPGIASAATSIVLAHIAEGTKTIRVGAGGIMLPNHAPYVIAEQFGTLARLFPGRIDLGLGRAPGTDQLTLRALRRTPEAADNFPQDILELQAFLAPAGSNQRIQAVPAAGTEVPLWILGSSHFGAMVAAELGLPYAFASHFAPEELVPALQIYRSRFKPSEQLGRPYAMVGVNVIAADSDEEGRRLATTQQMSFTNLLRGSRGLSQPPIDDIEGYWSLPEKAQAMRMLARSIVGSAETVRTGIDALVSETGADELVIVSDIYDHPTRLRSFELISKAAGVLQAP